MTTPIYANIAVLPGDGIGPEVTREAVRALQTIADQFGHRFTFTEHPIGGAGIDTSGDSLPPPTLDACGKADAVLLGAIGGPSWDHLPQDKRPESGLLALRQRLGLYANIRPTVVHDSMLSFSPLKPEVVRNTDLVVVRELTGGSYFGRHEYEQQHALDECVYTVEEIERIARTAGRIAQGRKGRVVSVDKANVLATSQLWRTTTQRIFDDEFAEIQMEHALVDSTAMRLLTCPSSFDVILTENMFGDILSDEASALAGTLGLAPSASLGAGSFGVYEPVHGSAPDIAGANTANPFAAILSAAMLLRHSLRAPAEAKALEQAVYRCVEQRFVTYDLVDGPDALPTTRAGHCVLDALQRPKTA